jgi:hypothetical protein
LPLEVFITVATQKICCKGPPGGLGLINRPIPIRQSEALIVLYRLQGLLELYQVLTVPSEKSRTKVARGNIVVMHTNELIVLITGASPSFEGDYRIGKLFLLCGGKKVLVLP